jgi:hypothetical protein
MIAVVEQYPYWFAASGTTVVLVVYVGKTIYDRRRRRQRATRLDSLVQNNALKGFEKR